MENITGFGAHSAQEVEQLQKALAIGAEYATTTPGNLTGGPALAMESLDRTLRTVTYGMQHLRLWKDIVKESVGQTVHEMNVQNGYGKDTSPFYQMGSNPVSTDAGYNRDVAIVKYLGTRGSVQLNLTQIQAAHGPVIAREVKNKTVELLGKMERALFEADSEIHALEFDGIDKLITSKAENPKYKSVEFVGYTDGADGNSPVIDVRGDISEEVLERAALTAVNNFSYPMDLYLDTHAHSTFSRQFYAKERVRPGETSAAGYLIPEFAGSLNFKLKGNVFNIPRKIALSVATTSQAAPVPSAFATPADAASKFSAGDAGTYSYIISAVYADGETLPSAQQATAVAAGDRVEAVLTYSGSPIYFNVFRAPVGATVGHKWIGRIAPAGTAALHVLDRNARLPGHGKAYLLMHDAEALCFKQLGTLTKFDLAVVDTSYSFNILLHGMPVCPLPRKHVILANVQSAV